MRTNSTGTRHSHETNWIRTVLALVFFATAFGYVEAAVVSYLRLLHEPARLRFHPGRSPADLFPLLTLDQLRASGSEQSQTLAIELGREAATIAMLAAVALAVARNAGQWAAAFVIAFGTWDITFYVFLKILLGWPASLLTWDILFLVPVPWVGPVLAPVLVSATMLALGIWHLGNEARGRNVRIGLPHWVGIIAAGVIVVFSFTMDYRNIMSGGKPHPFNWGVFSLGMILGIASYAGTAYQRRNLQALTAAAAGPVPESAE